MNHMGGVKGDTSYDMPPQYSTVTTTGLVSRSNIVYLSGQGDRWFVGRVTALL